MDIPTKISTNNFNYKNYIINNSKAYKNKISVFKNNNFIGDFYFIIEVKNLINKNLI